MSIDKALSYGLAFDETVEMAANAMTRLGYPSKHASVARRAVGGNPEELRAAVAQLGMLCLRMENELVASFSATAALPADRQAGFLAIYATARRVVTVTRVAQEAGLLIGRVAAEVDGDVDELEEQLNQLHDVEGVVSAALSLVETASAFEGDLPLSIRQELASLRAALADRTGAA